MMEDILTTPEKREWAYKLLFVGQIVFIVDVVIATVYLILWALGIV